MAKTPKGELTSAEIRILIRGHNKMTNIKVPKGLDRDGLIKFLKSRNFEVDHKKKRLVDKSPARGKIATLETSKVITKPKPKTELQKQKAAEAKAEKAEKKKKEERVIRKKAVQEEKKRAKPKPKAKTTTIETQTETPKKPKKKAQQKYSKDEIIKVFKDIMTGYTEILEQGVGQGITQREVNTSKAVEKKLTEGKMTFTKPQKETIKKAIDAYIDTIEVDMPDSKELAIAKDLQKKYI